MDLGSIPDLGTKIPQAHAAAAAKSLQSCPTLCDPIDSSPPGSPIPGFLQARTLEWVAISFSSAWKWKVKVKSLSRVWLLATPWTAAYQAPLSMGFSRQEYWSGVPLPSPRLQSMGLQRIGHDWATNTHTVICTIFFVVSFFFFYRRDCVWGIWRWGLQAVGWSQVLVLS